MALGNSRNQQRHWQVLWFWVLCKEFINCEIWYIICTYKSVAKLVIYYPLGQVKQSKIHCIFFIKKAYKFQAENSISSYCPPSNSSQDEKAITEILNHHWLLPPSLCVHQLLTTSSLKKSLMEKIHNLS